MFKRLIIAALIFFYSPLWAAETALQVDFLLSGYVSSTTKKPLVNGYVLTYLDGTSTLSALWTDKDKSGTASNPFPLDAGGKAEVYGDNVYKIEIYEGNPLSGGTLVETINGLNYKASKTTIATLSDYGCNFATAAAQIGGTEKTHVIVACEPDRLTNSVSLTDNITLEWKAGNILSGPHTLTINRALIAGDYQLFGSDVTVTGLKSAYPEWWGIDGIADEVEINKAYQASDTVAFVPGKTYTCNDELTVPANKDLITDATFDFTGAAGAFGNDACVFNAGTATSLGGLGSAVSAGDKTITLSSGPSLSTGDIIMIYDSADSSYSGFRPFYRAGEMLEVDSVSGADVTVKSGSIASYSGGTITVYKINGSTSKFSGFTVLNDDVLNSLTIDYNVGGSVTDVTIPDAWYIGVLVKRSYNVRVDRCTSIISELHPTGDTYGFVVANSQNITLDTIYGSTPWQGFATGGGDYIGAIPNRYINVVNSTLKSSAATNAADLHGNTEFSGFNNCPLLEGVILAGNHSYVTNSFIKKEGTKIYAVHLTEATGFDHEISNNRVLITSAPGTGLGAFVDVGGNAVSIGPSTTAAGTLKIHGNKVDYAVAPGDIDAIKIRNRGCTANPLNIDIKDNEIKGLYTTRGNNYGISVDVISGSGYKWVSAKDNDLYAFGASFIGVISLLFNDNKISDCNQSGLYAEIGSVVSAPPVIYQVSGNSITYTKATGALISGASGKNITFVDVKGNLIAENSITAGGSSVSTSLSVFYAEKVNIDANTIGSGQAGLASSAYYFSINELAEGWNDYYGVGGTVKNSVTEVNITAASTGVGTVKMGSGNPADNAGFIEIAPNKFVPYWTTATP